MSQRSVLIFFSLVFSLSATAQSKKKTTAAPAPTASSAQNSITPQYAAQLNSAIQMVQGRHFQQAVPALYALSRRPEFDHERMHIKYLLGSSLMELGLNQIAAFQFVEVIKHGANRYVKQAIEKLSIAADTLGDDTLLNYAISKIKLDDIPSNGNDLIFFRLGEIKLRSGQYTAAVDVLNRVPPNSRYGFLAKYDKGLAFLEQKQPQQAISIFKELLSARNGAAVTDTNRIVAQLALARAYYQATDWDNSVAMYREIPKDHPLWHDALFESTWALFRSARLRTALSNFQSLHSAYYEDFYLPESLLLRAIVYLYICKYDEMDKVLNLFEKTYGPVRSTVNGFLNNADPLAYYAEIEAAYNKQNTHGDAKVSVGRMHLPTKVDFHVLREGDIKRAFSYLAALNEENRKLDSLSGISRSAVGAIGRKILGNRYKNAKIAIGDMVKTHLLDIKADLHDQYEQAEFIRYEMINGRKEQLKKKMAGKDTPESLVNDKVDRNMYVQNGYEYWPFDGEYWLDEIGNYHYLGKQSCE